MTVVRACAIALLAAMTACSPVRPTNLLTFGECGVAPNYIDAGTLHRFWPYPVTVSINVGTDVVPGDWVESYREAIRIGVELWSQALPQLQTVISYNNSTAAVQVDLKAAAPENIAGKATFSDKPEVSYATVALYRLRPVQGVGLVGPGSLEASVNSGAVSLAHWSRTVINIAAHEMGHVLGIGGHSPVEGDLMHPNGNYDETSPLLSWITASDRNTMSHAYCQ